VAIMAGLLLIMWSIGTGSEIIIAVPMIGGMIRPFSRLIVIPAVSKLATGSPASDIGRGNKRCLIAPD
jgi:Cu/Ag efflux pump CusA